jgi:hypothetical protein
VVELRRRGVYVEDIASEVGIGRRTVLRWLKAGRFPERKRRESKKPSPVAPYADYLYRRWRERCINMAQLYGEIKAMGYGGSYRRGGRPHQVPAQGPRPAGQPRRGPR